MPITHHQDHWPRGLQITALACTCLALLSGCGGGDRVIGDANAQTPRKHGTNNAITDVEGILVGQYQRIGGGYQTGTTVVWAPKGSMGGAYIGGGWPGTINTDALQPGKNEQKLDAAFLTGGSNYGLRSFTGIIDWLSENGYGTQTGRNANEVTPRVAGAVLFDLGRGGNFFMRPQADFGTEAIRAAKTGPVAQGNVGAGTGAVANGGMRVKGGVGTASEVADGVTIGVITAVNAAGTPLNTNDCTLNGTGININNEFATYAPPTVQECAAFKAAKSKEVDDIDSHPNTTITVVATDAKLTRLQANQLARAVNDGEARFIQPFNTVGDGDSVFAMATGKVEITDAQFQKLLSVSQDVAGRAIAHAILKTSSINGVTSYCDALPSACRAR